MTAGKPAAAYFFRGPDGFLHEECRQAAIASLTPETRDWCLTEIEFKPGRLERDLEGASQLPMLGGRNLLLFSDPEDFKGASEDDFEALSAYLAEPSPFATVIFQAVAPDRRRRFIQALEKKAAIVDMLPLGRQEAATWLADYLGRSGVAVESDLAREAVAKFEGYGEAPGGGKGSGINLLWLRTEVDKVLTTRLGAKRLDAADVELIVGCRREHEIGKLLGAVADRQFGQAVELLRRLFDSDEPETLVLWCLGDLFRQALKASPSREFAGGSRSRWANPFSTAEIAPRAQRAYSPEELCQAIRLARGADLNAKSSWKDGRLLLEALLWQIMFARGQDALSLSIAATGAVDAQG